MDKRNSNYRGQYWRPKPITKHHSHNFASGTTANLPCETPSSSKDDVSHPKSFGEGSIQFGRVNAPKSHRKIPNSPTSSRRKRLDLDNDVSRVEGVVTSSTDTFSHGCTLAASADSFSQIASGNKDDVSSYENPSSEARLRGNNSTQFNHLNTFINQCNPFHNCSGEKGLFPGVNNPSLLDNDAYDICQPLSASVNTLNPSLLVMNKLRREEARRSIEGQKIIELRSGMVLLKKYISYNDQVKIVKEIRDLGVGVGGFYEPGYRDGGKLHLKMMCLGKNWDPQKREYGDRRQTDDSKPPLIPDFFHQIVKGAIEASHSFLRERSKSLDVKRVLPLMSPNICIVNFYPKTGRLGLHQDKDESKESLYRQLPVVSFSIGDAAVFLYGDERDPEKADKVDLESGDVLIFGGKSRLVYHGVASILPNTAPKALLEETRLRPGRLNLTFREF